jgi:hypothetical protein
MRFLSALLLSWTLAVAVLAAGDQTVGNSGGLFSVVIEGPDHPVPPSSPVPIDLTITNTSDHDLYFEDLSGTGLNYRIDVYDGAGKRLARKPIGEQTLPMRRSTVTLTPGQRWRQELFLSGFYDFSEPGEYTVQLTGGEKSSQASVTSNSIKVDIAGTPLAPASGEGAQAFDLGIVGPPTVRVGSELKIKIGLRNVSGHEIVIPREKDGKAEFDYKVEVTQQGKPVAMTEYGRSLTDSKHSMPSTSWNDIHLQPNKVLTETIVISDLFDISKPGDYRVSVSRRDEISSWNRIFSNSQLIKVVP